MKNSRSNPKRKSHAGAKPNGPTAKQRRPGNHKPRQASNKKASTLDPNLLIKKAEPIEVSKYESDRTFEEMPISKTLKAQLKQKGFVRPSEIQDRTLEHLLEGRDMLGIAQTGTGKTGAFLIPIIEQLQLNRQKFYALVLVPTRELATQVEDEFRSMSKGMGLHSACFIGGTNINKDIQTLRRPTNIVISTPGRLLDLVERNQLNLGLFNTLVLDEFDRMLDMGFINDVKRVLKGMKNRKHNLLFSATLDKTQETMIHQILHNPVTVKVSTGTVTSDNIDQDIVRIEQGEDKFQVLFHLIKNEQFQKVLLFEETKHRVNRLCKKLNSSGIKADQIHGNKSQNARQNALNSFKEGRIQVLVATDVAARGIDVSDVTHVINYQVPMTMDSYIHRIGRTGRAGKPGKALTFVA